MKRAILTLTAALCAMLTLASCGLRTGIAVPAPNDDPPWKDETALRFGEMTAGRLVSFVTDGGIGVVGKDVKVHGQAAVLYLDMKEDCGVTVSYELEEVRRTVALSYEAPDGTKSKLIETNTETDANGTPVALKAGLGALILEGNASCSLGLTVEGLDPAKVNYVSHLSPGSPDAENLLDSWEDASSEAESAPSDGVDDYVREANQITADFVDGPTSEYLAGKLDDAQFREKAAEARDTLIGNAREALAALGFSGAELEELIEAESQTIGDVYLCVEDVMRPVKELAALEGAAYDDDNPFGAFKDVMGPMGKLTAAGKKWAGVFRADQDALRALEKKYDGRIPADYLTALTSKSQADQYADDLDMGDLSTFFPEA